MKQGVIGVVVLLMIGSAWEIGRSDGRGGGSGFSGSSSSFGGASKLKALSKKAGKGSLGALFKADKKGAKEKGAKAGLDSLVAKMKDSDESAKADMPMAAEGLGDAVKGPAADSLAAVMAAAKADAPSDDEAMAAKVAEMADALAAAPSGDGEALGEQMAKAMAESAPAAMAAAAPKMAAGDKMPPRRPGRVNPTVKAGQITITGSLSKRLAERALKRRHRTFLYCYQRQLRRNPRLKGKVTTQITINPKGRVSSAKIIQTTLRDADTEKCLVRRMRILRFPKPRGGVAIVNYPMTFDN